MLKKVEVVGKLYIPLTLCKNKYLYIINNIIQEITPNK